ncbi:hypothetical protein F0562_021372 [Nyssa sinensis]|uniref:Transcription factor CBF/NF-Y/archaeal histone domain-containing protein n=1 Tax=Nyssa sinensis TaxID=561372 RepID=A0A5J5BJ31_9ASTE|nr:hypothetical protein F0562_021372 [Nyssa sinensis]
MVDNIDIEGLNYNYGGGSGEDGQVMKEQDRLLPIANVGRIMKQILPANAKISKEAKETMQECVSEFISFVTGEASDKCHKEKRKTVNGDDICWALGTLGFDDYAEPLKRENSSSIQGNRNSNPQQSSFQSSGGTSQSAALQCQICNRIGHTSLKCWYRLSMSGRLMMKDRDNLLQA